jgi:hypothetical protein
MQTSFNQQIAAIKKAISKEPVDSLTYLALNDAMATIAAAKLEQDKRQATAQEIANDLPEDYD